MKKILFLCALATMLSGCTTFEKYTLGDLGQSYYYNPSLPRMEESSFQLELSKAKAECKMEAYKLQIPSPSCSTIPAPSCVGLAGFALGFCQAQPPHQKCDYSSVNAAESARSEILDNCMIAKGWLTGFKPGNGTNTSGGVFEKIAKINYGADEFYLKVDSIYTKNDIAKAIVRKIDNIDISKSYQGYFYFNNKEKWFKVDDGQKIQIPKGSAAKLILDRINDLI